MLSELLLLSAGAFELFCLELNKLLKDVGATSLGHRGGEGTRADVAETKFGLSNFRLCHPPRTEHHPNEGI
jgi:hypothetical protein